MKESIQKKQASRAAAHQTSETTQRKEVAMQLMEDEEIGQMKAADNIQLMDTEEEMPM